MIEIYNKYISLVKYNSDIIFINSKTTILEKQLYCVKYGDKNISNYYLDSNKYLRNLYWGYKNDKKSILSETDGVIKDVQPLKKNYSYIRIIKDSQHPELEGEIMIYQYGYRILSIIKEYLDNKRGDGIEHLFNLKSYLIDGYLKYPNYDKSKFYKTKASETDILLDIESEIKIKTIELPIKLSRKEKLKMINK